MADVTLTGVRERPARRRRGPCGHCLAAVDSGMSAALLAVAAFAAGWTWRAIYDRDPHRLTPIARKAPR